MDSESENEPQALPNRESPAHEAGLGPCFPVATHKFIVLSVCSFGIYTLYWFYQDWKRVRSASHEMLSPFWRTFFAPLWAISLLRRIHMSAEAAEGPITWNAETLGVLYIALTVCMQLPEPWWLVTFGSFVPFVPAVRTVQQVNEAAGNPEGRNSRYSAANVVTIVVGGLLFVLVVVGTIRPK
jgi:hypothetical protein